MGWNVCVCSHDVWPGLGLGKVEGTHYRTVCFRLSCLGCRELGGPK